MNETLQNEFDDAIENAADHLERLILTFANRYLKARKLPPGPERCTEFRLLRTMRREITNERAFR
jgi:hypothetical protein